MQSSGIDIGVQCTIVAGRNNATESSNESARRLSLGRCEHGATDQCTENMEVVDNVYVGESAV